MRLSPLFICCFPTPIPHPRCLKAIQVSHFYTRIFGRHNAFPPSKYCIHILLFCAVLFLRQPLALAVWVKGSEGNRVTEAFVQLFHSSSFTVTIRDNFVPKQTKADEQCKGDLTLRIDIWQTAIDRSCFIVFSSHFVQIFCFLIRIWANKQQQLHFCSSHLVSMEKRYKILTVMHTACKWYIFPQMVMC